MSIQTLSDSLFRTIVDRSSDAITLVDAQGITLYASPSILRILGCSPEEIVGRPASELIHPDDWPRCAEQLARVVSEPGSSLKAEYRIRHSDGSWRWLEGTGTNLLHEPGVQAIVTVSRDITPQKRERDRAAEILESISDAFYAVDSEWRLTYVNGRAEQIWGRNRSQLLGTKMWDQFPELVGGDAYQQLHRVMQERRPGTFEVMSRYLDSWVEVSAYPSDEGLSVYFRDITDRKRAEALLRQSEAQLQRLVQANVIGIIRATLQGGIIEANDAFLQMLGYSRDDLRSGMLRWDDLTPPEWGEMDRRALEQFRTLGTCDAYEKENIRKDGSRVPILLGGALLDPDQGAVICFVLDLSERKQVRVHKL